MAPDFAGAVWKTSSYSGSESQCVSVADVTPTHGGIAIRDSKDPDGPALLLGRATFSAFVADIREV
nr:DUF397 domain-containing protein [Streptomyces sp. RFCAC02]